MNRTRRFMSFPSRQPCHTGCFPLSISGKYAGGKGRTVIPSSFAAQAISDAPTLLQRWRVKDDGLKSYFRCGSTSSLEVSRMFILICRFSVSRRRRYAMSCSSSASNDDGGSCTDQSWCRPAPGISGHVSVLPLQRRIPSSHRIPKVGWMK